MGEEIEGGVAAEAEVLGMAPTAEGARHMGEAEAEYTLELAVTLPDGSTEQVQHTCLVPHDKVPGFGQRIPVTVSGSDPHELVVQWDALGSLTGVGRAAVEAAQAGDTEAEERAFEQLERDPPPS
jgi:hypothetical protein